MSLTFDFPQWSLRISGDKQRNNPREDEVAAEGIDWEADLNELGSEGGERECLGIPGGLEQYPEEGQQVEGHQERKHQHLEQLSEERVADAGGRESSLAIATDYVSEQIAPELRRSGEAHRGVDRTTKPANRNDEAAASDSARFNLARPRPAPATVAGDSIPAEVLLLVLSELRDVADCMRAALVCKHWLAVVTMSNELWYELHARHLAGDTWQRPPYMGSPLLRPPLGGDHTRSKMLSYKTVCKLTQVAVRFMALRKGFEYVVEAAASLWLAVQRAAGVQDQAGAPQGPSEAAAGATAQLVSLVASRSPFVDSIMSGSSEASRDRLSLPSTASETYDGNRQLEGLREQQQQQQQPPNNKGSAKATAAGVAQEVLWGSEAGTSSAGYGGDGWMAVGSNAGGAGTGADPAGAGAGAGLASGSHKAKRITHVDQLWESCGRGRSALQVDERFNAVRVQQMVGKLCCSGGAQWLPLYEGVAAVMASRCDEIWDELRTAAAVAASSRGAPEPTTEAALPSHGTTETVDNTPSGSGSNGGGGGSHSGSTRGIKAGSNNMGHRGHYLNILRGEIVYGGSSYADQFAELLRRGDTRGALALKTDTRKRMQPDDHSGPVEAGVGGLCGDLDEPEMREILVQMPDEKSEEYESTGVCTLPYGSGAPNVPAFVQEGLLLWQRLLRAWALYRRWLEVLVVWCGPLGARVEAERQLAGATAAHGEAPLAPPHLTNKGLLLFRSQVLLAYPLRRPLQAAALWLSVRVSLGDVDGGGSGSYGNHQYDYSDAARSGRWSGFKGRVPGGGVEGCLTDEQAQLLTGIRKVLTELAVPDDVTQPAHMHTHHKLQRCFGRLLLRPAPGGTRALLLAHRIQGHRGAAQAGMGGGGSSLR